jgi:hypothetical protein
VTGVGHRAVGLALRHFYNRRAPCEKRRRYGEARRRGRRMAKGCVANWIW